MSSDASESVSLLRMGEVPVKTIGVQTLHFYCRVMVLFEANHSSLGSRKLMKVLRKEGLVVTRYRVMKLMDTLGLIVTQRVAYKVTTQRKHSDAVANNLLNQNVNPIGPNQIWAGDVIYLQTGEGWMYLAIVMDLYSHRIIGWHIDKRMTTSLISRAMIHAYNLKRPPIGCVFHSDRRSQHTSKRFTKLLKSYNIRASIGDAGACWDNAVVERFFGSLKHD